MKHLKFYCDGTIHFDIMWWHSTFWHHVMAIYILASCDGIIHFGIVWWQSTFWHHVMALYMLASCDGNLHFGIMWWLYILASCDGTKHFGIVDPCAWHCRFLSLALLILMMVTDTILLWLALYCRFIWLSLFILLTGNVYLLTGI